MLYPQGEKRSFAHFSNPSSRRALRAFFDRTPPMQWTTMLSSSSFGIATPNRFSNFSGDSWNPSINSWTAKKFQAWNKTRADLQSFMWLVKLLCKNYWLGLDLFGRSTWRKDNFERYCSSWLRKWAVRFFSFKNLSLSIFASSTKLSFHTSKGEFWFTSCKLFKLDD